MILDIPVTGVTRAHCDELMLDKVRQFVDFADLQVLPSTLTLYRTTSDGDMKYGRVDGATAEPGEEMQDMLGRAAVLTWNARYRVVLYSTPSPFSMP